jgi:excisionase family DNA binding protein
MSIDLAKELADALRRPEVRDLFRDLVSAAVRQHLQDPRQHDPEELLNAEGAASLMGMTPGAVRKAAARGTLRCTRVGCRLRFRRADLLAARNDTGRSR